MTKQTTTHICSKEVEIEMLKLINGDMKEKIDEIHKHIIGNGRPGLLERVSNNEIVLKVGYSVIAILLSAITVFAALQ